MNEFQKSYSMLNKDQKKAVDNIEGPVLVIAGPGTGKTQLLTTRVANIIAKTDTDASEILCLTFTESGASNMRSRLNNMIGKDSYSVNINTYHGFGNDLIRNYYQFFPDYKITKPAEQLTLDKIVRKIQSELPYGNPIKGDVFIRSIKKIISNAKREFLTPEDLLKIARSNLDYLNIISESVAMKFHNFERISKKTSVIFIELYKGLLATETDNQDLSGMITGELKHALDSLSETNKTSGLTKWKNRWLEKNSSNQLVLKGISQNKKIESLADVYSSYEKELQKHGIYDYDDMIGLTITALENNDEFRYNIQEKYQYILLDEFQDTNGAQFKLVDLLTSNPLFEGRPNVMAVGDDDQAIYSFQGANYSHMANFYKKYKDVTVITLNDNYRSIPDIINLAKSVSGQIEERLVLPNMASKNLIANKKNQANQLKRVSFNSEISQFGYIANQIKEKIDSGIPAREIAIIGRKHKNLVPIVPYLHKNGIKLRYEKKENILEDPHISILVVMAKLVLALKHSKKSELNALWPEVLSANFFSIPTSKLWEISWDAFDNKKEWRDILIADPSTKNICLFFYRLSLLSEEETLESMLDYLIGIKDLDLNETEQTIFTSGFYKYYFSEKAQTESSITFWELLQNLTVLRQRLRDYSANQEDGLKLKKFIEFIDENNKSEIKIMNNSPMIESEDAVYISTAHSVKGLEFNTVFVIDTLESVWGGKSKDEADKITSPPTLEILQSIGTNEDERIRLFYVAITRAKNSLIITDYDKTSSDKNTVKLKYLAEYDDAEGNTISPYLPETNSVVVSSRGNTPTINEMISYWQSRHEDGIKEIKLKDMLSERLENFKLSPTNLNKFTNVEREGPRSFFIDSLLKFPKAKFPIAEYGTSIHKSLEWLYKESAITKEKPSLEKLLDIFHTNLESKDISESEKKLLEKRGDHALAIYLNQANLDESDMVLSEVPFAAEHVFIGDAHISGNIDKLIIDTKKRTATIVDYKTGKSYSKWTSDVKLHNYKRQMYFYKLMIESSNTYKKYKVVDAYLEFVEPDQDGNIHKLHMVFDDKAQLETKGLIESVYKKIVELDLPDISKYPKTLKGIKLFEQDLLKNS